MQRRPSVLKTEGSRESPSTQIHEFLFTPQKFLMTSFSHLHKKFYLSIHISEKKLPFSFDIHIVLHKSTYCWKSCHIIFLNIINIIRYNNISWRPHDPLKPSPPKSGGRKTPNPQDWCIWTYVLLCWWKCNTPLPVAENTRSCIKRHAYESGTRFHFHLSL